jgi:hypothetical protein
MRTTRAKSRHAIGRSQAERNGNKVSFRDLKAFGMWRNRTDLEDPVQFTNELRARIERRTLCAREITTHVPEVQVCSAPGGTL